MEPPKSGHRASSRRKRVVYQRLTGLQNYFATGCLTPAHLGNLHCGPDWTGRMQLDQIRRRQFITLLGGAAAWPLAARAQEPERRRIGGLLSPAAGDLEYQGRIAALQQALQQLGWTDARNVRIDIRWGLGWDTELIRKNVAEMVALTPDVILAIGSRIVGALQQATRTMPIVFV